MASLPSSAPPIPGSRCWRQLERQGCWGSHLAPTTRRSRRTSSHLNAAGQCLHHALPLTKYFLEARHVPDINAINCLGLQVRGEAWWAMICVWGGGCRDSTLAPGLECW